MPLLKLVFITLILFPHIVYADTSDESFVGIALDKATCKDGGEGFIPIPSVIDDHELRLRLISDELSDKISQKAGEGCAIRGFVISGKITSRTYPTLKLALTLMEKRPKTDDALILWVDSQGGLVLEAMKIGKLVSKHGMKAIITINGKCYSSCVLIYAAATTRGGIGELGIHRPFSSEISTENITYEEYLSAYKGVSKLMKEYLSAYGVSPNLVDQMNVIPSDEMKIVGFEDREKYGLGFKNIASTEYKKAKTIQVCGKDYYDLHLSFHGLIKSCRKRFGISVLDEKDNECWELARQAFPEYSNKFDECKVKKSKGIGR